MTMTPTQIKGAIMFSADLSIEELAKYHGYSKAAFYQTINGSSRSKKIRTIIEGVCAPIKIIWPENNQNRGSHDQ